MKLIKRLFRICISPIWKPIHWLFVEDVFFIEEKRTLQDRRHASWRDDSSDFEVKSTFFPGVKKRGWPFGKKWLTRDGIKECYKSNYYGSEFNSKQLAQKAIEVYKKKKKENRVVVHKL